MTLPRLGSAVRGRWGAIGLVALTHLCFGGTAKAQSIRSFEPGAILERDAEGRRREAEDRRLRRQRLESGPLVEEERPAPRAEAGEAEVRFTVRRIDVDESAILRPEEVRALIDPLVGRSVTLGELQDLTARINDLYRQKGFVTAKAILPPQRIREGVVHIQLIEARIGEIGYRGNLHTREAYLRQRQMFRPGELVDVNRAQEALRRFNRVEDVKLRLVLRPGTAPGTTDYVIEVYEPTQYAVDVYSDDFGQKSTGRWRGGATVSTPSLSGWRDALDVGGYGTAGISAAYANYSLPVTSWRTRLNISGDYTHVESVEGPAAAFELGGESYHIGLAAIQPVWVRPDFVVRLLAEGHARRSHLAAGVDVPPQSGIDLSVLDNETDVRTAAVGVTGELNDEYGVTILTHRVGRVFDLGEQRFDETRADYGRSRPNFYKYQGSLLRQHSIASWLWLTLRAEGQSAWQREIVAAEQLQAGGNYTVRGYPEGFALGDDGYLTSAQLNAVIPALTSESAGSALGVSLFVDHAGLYSETVSSTATMSGGMPIRRVESHSTYLTSVGVGFTLGWRGWLAWRLDVGVPLAERDSVHGAELHFALHVTPPVERLVN